MGVTGSNPVCTAILLCTASAIYAEIAQLDRASIFQIEDEGSKPSLQLKVSANQTAIWDRLKLLSNNCSYIVDYMKEGAGEEGRPVQEKYQLLTPRIFIEQYNWFEQLPWLWKSLMLPLTPILHLRSFVWLYPLERESLHHHRCLIYWYFSWTGLPFSFSLSFIYFTI